MSDLSDSSTKPKRRRRDSLPVAVADQRFPEYLLCRKDLKEIYGAIEQAHLALSGKDPPVMLNGTKNYSGFLVIYCEDQEAVNWVQGAIPALTTWSLKIFLGPNVPKPFLCSTFVPDEWEYRLEEDEVLLRLQDQNPELRPENWNVWKTLPVNDGQIWMFSVDKKSMKYLRSLDMRPNFGSKSIFFRLREDEP